MFIDLGILFSVRKITRKVMYLCPYFVVCLKQYIVGVSETRRMLFKV